MKLSLKLGVPKIHFGTTADERVRFLRKTAFALCAAYALWLLWISYTHVVLGIIFPEEIDQSQVQARQEKVNRKLLETITDRNEARQHPATFEGIRSPF